MPRLATSFAHLNKGCAGRFPAPRGGQGAAGPADGAGSARTRARWPNQGTVASDDWYAKEDPAYFHGPDVLRLHRWHLAVIPYTINRESTMERVIDLGDGIITDDPDLLVLVAKRNGLR